jgi:membrane protein
MALAVFVVLATTLVLAGPQLADWLARRFGFGSFFLIAWKVLQWPFAVALVSTAIGLVYYFAPDAEQDWSWITPGSLLATLLWLVVSLVFRMYVVRFGNYEATYGAIGAVIILLTWFYLTGLVILVGAELNAEIEHASPWGKAPGEKVPGQKRKLGAAAARAFHLLRPGRLRQVSR